MSQNSSNMNDKNVINISDDDNDANDQPAPNDDQPNPAAPNDQPAPNDPQPNPSAPNDDQPNPDPMEFKEYGLDMETHLANRRPFKEISHLFTEGVFHSNTIIPSLAIRGGPIKDGVIQGSTKIPAWQCECEPGSSSNPLKRLNFLISFFLLNLQFLP